MTKSSLFVLSLLMAGCAVMSSESTVTPSDLNEDAAHYNGRSVTVQGYLVLEPEARHIFESRSLELEFRRMVQENPPSFDPRAYHKYCLTLLNADFMEQHRELFKDKEVKVRGRFISNYLDGSIIDLQACPLPGALFLDELDVKRLYDELSRTQPDEAVTTLH